MCPGFRHIERGVLSRYSTSIQVKTYESGERRIGTDPPSNILETAFSELGTYSAVASAFGVSRDVVGRWIRKYGLVITPHPEAGLANAMRRRLGAPEDTVRVSQWLTDEGSVSVAYFRRGDYTMLIVCGSMNDYAVLSALSGILDTPITSSKSPGSTTLPMGAIRIQSARAYALLQVIGPHLVGLKAMETKAALAYFPSSGLVRGRHTTDEFFLPVWKDFALDTLCSWNSRRRVKIRQEAILVRAEKWVEGRTRRARRFIDSSGGAVNASKCG